MTIPVWQPTPRTLAVLKGVLFLACLIPATRLLIGALTDGLGPNPLEHITRNSGTWTFNFLLITLTVTPARQLLGWPWLIRLRRMLGLFCFFYACLHFSAFVWFDHFFDWQAIARDVLKRPFVTVGFAAFVLLWPLALTSNQAAMRWLGGRRWQNLHRSIYAIGILACVHYFWLVKPIALLDPLTYAFLLAILLGYRARARRRAFTAGGAAETGGRRAPRQPGWQAVQFVRPRRK